MGANGSVQPVSDKLPAPRVRPVLVEQGQQGGELAVAHFLLE
jgi:hypothetical protein